MTFHRELLAIEDQLPRRWYLFTRFDFQVTDGEPLQSVRARLRERLDVPEKEFEKYKFALLTSAKIVRYLDMDSENRVNLAELGHTHMAR